MLNHSQNCDIMSIDLFGLGLHNRHYHVCYLTNLKKTFTDVVRQIVPYFIPEFAPEDPLPDSFVKLLQIFDT